ncbi:MAG: nucleotidyltransferase domain-containing protein [Candidatus Marinimicrobia bacterium]|nr:nucleotidyltransferase domain-containing protein [Candidatus Neomarinimicrobiota bacterium]
MRNEKLKKEEILMYLLNNKNLFNDKFNIYKIGIFGSYARNEQTENSDIDIIMEMKLDTTEIYEKKRDLRKMLEEQFNRKIDICRERSIKTIFRNFVKNEAIYV